MSTLVNEPPTITRAALLETPGLRELRIAVAQLFEVGGIIVVNGPPGVGKTYATTTVLRDAGLPLHWADMPDTPKAKKPAPASTPPSPATDPHPV